LNVAVPHFGRVTKLLVEDGAEVRPSQPLLEYDERPPTEEEWWAELERLWEAEGRVRELEQLLENPARAAWASIRRRLGGCI
jgi:multidrug efflux pump subunit AcrA (membrane-fusion protein)